jgi:hypothetical protein
MLDIDTGLEHGHNWFSGLFGVLKVLTVLPAYLVLLAHSVLVK